MSQLINRSELMTFVTNLTRDLDSKKARLKLSVMAGYFFGQTMNVVRTDDTPATNRFMAQWPEMESQAVLLNELRPVDFELVKSTARCLFLARCRIMEGGIANLYLSDVEYTVLNPQTTTDIVTEGAGVLIGEMTEFFRLMLTE